MKKFKEFIKPRNPVAKNQRTAGAGPHKDKKRAYKHGDVKHKKSFDEDVAEGETTLTKTGRIHRSTGPYGGSPRAPDPIGDKLDKSTTNRMDRALGVKWKSRGWRGGVVVDETVLNPKDPHGDYIEKSKTLHKLSMNKGVDQKHVQQRKLDLNKEYEKYRKV